MRIAVVLAGALVLGSSLGVAALATGSAPSFARARSFAVGSYPYSVAIGDLNGEESRTWRPRTAPRTPSPCS